MQSIKINLSSVVELDNTLIEYIKTLQTMFNTYEKLVQDKFEDNTFLSSKQKNRKRKNKLTNPMNRIMCGYQHFKINTFYHICDNLLNELIKRKEAYDSLILKYLFILKLLEYNPSELRS